MTSPRPTAPELPARLARHLGAFERRVVEVEGLRLHVMEAGAAGNPAAPVALLVHGNPTWGFLWRKVAGALAGTGLRVVMPDLPGLGLSEKPRDPSWHTLERHAAVLRGLVRSLGNAPVVLAVHDWGGPIGVLAMSGLADRLAGLVVTNTVLRPPRDGHRPTAFHRFANLPGVAELAFHWLGFPQNLLQRTQADPDSISGDVAFAYRWPLRDRADRAAPLALARMVPTGGAHPSLEGLRTVEAFTGAFAGPAAIVWADQDPILARALKRNQELLPRASVITVPAGHYLQEEAPVPIADAIREVARKAIR
ncbi:MAG: alpha/beta fold hydrolase [Anaeromyxobacter sp.]